MNTKKNLMIITVIKLFLLTALSALLVAACSSLATQRSNTLAERAEIPVECRVVQHSLGETCIPVKPQRIIALDPPHILDPLLALGVRSIVGIGCYNGLALECVTPGLSSDDLKDMETVGVGSLLSLEKILALKPDLILGLDDARQIYNKLSAIAPTIITNYSDIRCSFKSHLRGISQLLNRAEVAENLLIQYQNKVLELRRQIGNRLEGKEISVVTYTENQFWAAPSCAIYFQLLQDIGVKVKPALLEINDFSYFSMETINNYDADILFILFVGGSNRRSASFFLEHPLISSLDAVKNGRTYIINDREQWDVFGPLGVNRLLDLLSKHLLEAASSF